MDSTPDQHKYSAASSDKEEAAAFAQANIVASSYAVSMTLKAVIELGIFDVIDSAGPGCQLSAADISDRTSTANPQGPAVLDRMLRFLASSSILTCSVVEGVDGRLERRYGLTRMCKFFVNRGDGATIVPLMLMNMDKVFHDSW